MKSPEFLGLEEERRGIRTHLDAFSEKGDNVQYAA
jgi:hypothetical protein